MSKEQQTLTEREKTVIAVFSKQLEAQFDKKAEEYARKIAALTAEIAEQHRWGNAEVEAKKAYDATVRLLQNYRMFKMAAETAVYDASTAQEVYETNGIFRDLLSQTGKEEIKLESIKKTALRTKWMVDNIDLSVSALETYAKRMGEDMRINVAIMRKFYMEPIPVNEAAPKMKEIAEDMGIAISSATQRRDTAVRKLSVILWGVSALGM